MAPETKGLKIGQVISDVFDSLCKGGSEDLHFFVVQSRVYADTSSWQSQYHRYVDMFYSGGKVVEFGENKWLLTQGEPHGKGPFSEDPPVASIFHGDISAVAMPSYWRSMNSDDIMFYLKDGRLNQPGFKNALFFGKYDYENSKAQYDGKFFTGRGKLGIKLDRYILHKLRKNTYPHIFENLSLVEKMADAEVQKNFIASEENQEDYKSPYRYVPTLVPRDVRVKVEMYKPEFVGFLTEATKAVLEGQYDQIPQYTPEG